MTAFEFFLQVSGFALQTVPVALLMCLPFENAELRFSRFKTYLILIAADAAASIAFGFAEPAMLQSENRVQMANLYMIIFIVIIFGIYFFLVRSSVLNRFLIMIMLIHYAAVLFTCSNIIMRLPSFKALTSSELVQMIYGIDTNVAFMIITLITLPAVWIFMRTVVRKAIKLADSKSMKRGFIYLMLALVIYCAAALLFDFMFDRSAYNNVGGIIFFAAFVVTDFIIYYMFFFETKLVRENEKLEARLKSFDEQYKRISRGIDESKRLRHDMRHHLNAISAINKKRENKELTEYLEAYSAVYSELEDVSSCGYHALDNILRYYISVAKEKGIVVTTRYNALSADLDFDVTDMTVLMGNLLENAIEACERITDAEKFIKISIKQSEASLLIKTENSCRGDTEPRADYTGGEEFVSTKHTKHPGQGLRSITTVAEKYGGSAEFKRENGLFTARAVLNIP